MVVPSLEVIWLNSSESADNIKISVKGGARCGLVKFDPALVWQAETNLPNHVPRLELIS